MVSTREDRIAVGVDVAHDAKASDNPRLHIDGLRGEAVRTASLSFANNSDQEPSVHRNFLPAPTATDTQSIQETQEDNWGLLY